MTRNRSAHGKRHTGEAIAVAEDAAGRRVVAVVERAEDTKRAMREAGVLKCRTCGAVVPFRPYVDRCDPCIERAERPRDVPHTFMGEPEARSVLRLIENPGPASLATLNGIAARIGMPPDTDAETVIRRLRQLAETTLRTLV